MKDVYISPILNIRIKLSNDSRIKERRTNLQIPIDLVHVALEDYLPIKIRERIYGLLQWYGVFFSIDERGDSACVGDKRNNRIEVRVYQWFLDTPIGFFHVFLHEMSHAIEFKSSPDFRSNHGKRFQEIYHQLLKENIDIYPEELRPVVQKMIDIPVTTRKSTLYEELEDVILDWPNKPEKYLTLDEIPNGSEFNIRYNGWGTGNYYIKREKSKSTWLCINDFTGKKRYIKGDTKVYNVNGRT